MKQEIRDTYYGDQGSTTVLHMTQYYTCMQPKLCVLFVAVSSTVGVQHAVYEDTADWQHCCQECSLFIEQTVCVIQLSIEWYKWVLTNLYHYRQLYNTLIPPSHESPAAGLQTCTCIPRYTTPNIHCRHMRHECDGWNMLSNSHCPVFSILEPKPLCWQNYPVWCRQQLQW